MRLEKDMTVRIVPEFEFGKVSNRTRNRIKEHGNLGFIIMHKPKVPAFDNGMWIHVRSLEENVSLAKWGFPGKKEVWEGWLPMSEIRIKPL